MFVTVVFCKEYIYIYIERDIRNDVIINSWNCGYSHQILIHHMILSDQKTHDQRNISFYQFLCGFLEYINREKQKSNRSQLARKCERANASHGSFDSCSAVAKAFENSHILPSICSICVNDRILKPLFC